MGGGNVRTYRDDRSSLHRNAHRDQMKVMVTRNIATDPHISSI